MADLGQLCPSFEPVSPTIKLNLDILKGAGSLTALKYQVIYVWCFPPLLVTNRVQQVFSVSRKAATLSRKSM